MLYPWLVNAVFTKEGALKQEFKDDVDALQKKFSSTVIEVLRKLESADEMVNLETIVGTTDVSDVELDNLVLSIYHLENESDILDDYAGDSTEHLESLLKADTPFDVSCLVGGNTEAAYQVHRLHRLYALIRNFVDST